jgi:hypothetical protein
MPTARPFAYNSGTTISGTDQVGDIAVGVSSSLNYSQNEGGVRWWNGPDEDLGYVITHTTLSGTQPNPDNVPSYIGFWRSSSKTENSFITLTNGLFGQNFTTGDECKTYLNNNGYWTSWDGTSTGIVTDNLFMELDASNYTSGSWSDETGNGNNATINGATWLSDDGGIFDFDGVKDTISVPHNSSLSLSTTTQKTVQVWVKFDSLGGLNQQIPVFGKLSSSFGFDGYWGGLFSTGGVVRCVTNGTAVQKISNSTLTVTTNTWYLLTFISQITSTSNTTKVYVNETEYITNSHGNDSYNENNPFYLGYIGSGVSSLYLNGKIGACYFYTKGLNTTEISQNYNATKSKYGL